MNKDDDVFQYWLHRRESFPILYSIAKDILINPATNTTAESLFSASGAAVTEVRTRLSADKVNKLTFLKKNHLKLKPITNATSSISTCDGELLLNKNSNDFLSQEKIDDTEEPADEIDPSFYSDFYF